MTNYSPNNAAPILPPPRSPKPNTNNNTSNIPDPSTAATVLTTEIQFNSPSINHSLSSLSASPAVIDIPVTPTVSPIKHQNSIGPTTPNTTNPGLRTIELSTGRIREGFANGDIIVTLLPVNTKWPWITPAVFRPELVPEELMAQGLTVFYLDIF